MSSDGGCHVNQRTHANTNRVATTKRSWCCVANARPTKRDRTAASSQHPSEMRPTICGLPSHRGFTWWLRLRVCRGATTLRRMVMVISSRQICLLVTCKWRYCCRFWAFHGVSVVPIGALLAVPAAVAFGCVCLSHVSGWLRLVEVFAVVPLGVSCFLSCRRGILGGPSERSCFIAAFGYKRPRRASRVLQVGSQWHGFTFYDPGFFETLSMLSRIMSPLIVSPVLCVGSPPRVVSKRVKWWLT